MLESETLLIKITLNRRYSRCFGLDMGWSTLLEPEHFQLGNKLAITKGYGVRVTMIEGQNAFAPLLCFA